MKVINNGGENLNPFNPDHLSQTQLWLLLLAGVLSEMNKVRHDTLYGLEVTEENIKVYKKVLERDWNINNREQLCYNLDWVINEGHRTSFNNRYNYLSLLPYSFQEKKISIISSEDPSYKSFQLAKLCKYKLSKSGITAWDIGRYVFLCRSGALLNYITDEEAWEFMAKIGLITQKLYSSWYEYGLAYIVGRLEWLDKLTEENAKKHAKWLHNLILKEGAPWSRVPWDIQLDI